MESAVYRTPKLFDGQLYRLVRDLLDIDSGGSARISYALNHTQVLSSETDFTKLIESNDRLIQTLSFSFSENIREVVSFHRGVVVEAHWLQHPNSHGFNQFVPNANFDEIGLFKSPHNHIPPDSKAFNKEQVFSITRLLSKLSVDSTFVGQSETAISLADIVQGEVAELKNLHIEMTRGLAAAQKGAYIPV